jgi:WD40 repeat protein
LRIIIRFFPNVVMNAIGICVGSQHWLLLVAGGRLCAMVAHKLLCVPGQRVTESPFRRGTAIHYLHHFFVEATVPCVATFAGYSYVVSFVAFHPRGHVLATGSNDNTAKVWK